MLNQKLRGLGKFTDASNLLAQRCDLKMIMKTVITKAVKLLLITAIFVVLAWAVSIISVFVFQGNLHPDNWKTTWQDILLLVILGCIYFLMVWKIITKNRKDIKSKYK
jgi:zinc transporter ZupT